MVEEQSAMSTATPRDYHGDRPQVCWPRYWQVMAAKATETRPWWAVMAARIKEWFTRA
jgi:hypothetical protein